MPPGMVTSVAVSIVSVEAQAPTRQSAPPSTSSRATSTEVAGSVSLSATINSMEVSPPSASSS